MVGDPNPFKDLLPVLPFHLPKVARQRPLALKASRARTASKRFAYVIVAPLYGYILAKKKVSTDSEIDFFITSILREKGISENAEMQAQNEDLERSIDRKIKSPREE